TTIHPKICPFQIAHTPAKFPSNKTRNFPQIPQIQVRRQTPPPSHCFKHTVLFSSSPKSTVIQSIQGVHYLQCLNRSYALIEQHTSLFRLCNDLTGRKIIKTPLNCY